MTFKKAQQKIDQNKERRNDMAIGEVHHKLIGEVKCTETQTIKVSTHFFEGRKHVDIRYFNQNARGKWWPTKRGIRFRTHLGEEIIELLLKAQQRSLKKRRVIKTRVKLRGNRCIGK